MMKSRVDVLARRMMACVVCGIFAVSVVWAERISPEDAAVVANNFMNVASASAGVKKAPAKRMVMKAAASEQAEETQYYIYENADGEGWVMVAANDAVRPILAYSETGHFRTDNMPENVKEWLHGYNRQVKFAAQRAVPSAKAQQEWTRLRSGARQLTATPIVAPLVKTGWSQDEPFWNKCPTKSGQHTYVGCVATAMAQVMNYHQWPKQGTGSHSVSFNKRTYTVDFGATTYDWDNMLDLYDGSYTTAQANAVATLMYHCGVAVDMEYGTDGSGAYTVDDNGYYSQYEQCMTVETALPLFFGYEKDSIHGYERDGWEEMGMRSWTRDEWLAMLKEELDKARPIMYAGYGYDIEEKYDEESGEMVPDTAWYGHSFICDGYDSDDYFHFNFGWTNWCDGYYDVDVLETTDPGTGGGNGEYNYYQNVLIGIVPSRQEVDTVTLTWMVGNTVFATTESIDGTYVLPEETPESCDDKEFVGWCTTAGYSSETTAPAFIKNGGVITANTLYAVFATLSQSEHAEVSDTLTQPWTGISGTNYGSWSDKTATSDAVYAGQSAGGNDAIQIRSNNSNSGIVTTASGGKLKKVAVVWNENTSDDRTLDVYGKNSAYETPSDLYDASAKGTKLGSITIDSTTELVITGDYTFVGLRSKSGAMFLDSITITWEGSGESYSGYTTQCSETPQGIEETNANAKANAIKVLRDGQLLIICGEAVYTPSGIRIK